MPIHVSNSKMGGEARNVEIVDIRNIIHFSVRFPVTFLKELDRKGMKVLIQIKIKRICLRRQR